MKNLTLALIALVFGGVSSVDAGFPAAQPVEAGFPGLSQVEGSRPDSRPDTQDVFELVLRDGSRLFGRVERESSQEVVFRTTTGSTITASRADVLSLRRVKGRVANGEFRRSDEHRSRLFFAPTARSLERGTGICRRLSSSSRRSSRSASPTVFQWAVARP